MRRMIFALIIFTVISCSTNRNLLTSINSENNTLLFVDGKEVPQSCSDSDMLVPDSIMSIEVIKKKKDIKKYTNKNCTGIVVIKLK